MKEAVESMILAGDVGATKTILGLFASGNGRPSLVSQKTFRSASYQGLAPMVREFLADGNRAVSACFGVAGPVINNTAEVTNLSWFEDGQSLASDLKLERVSLINDIVAIGYGVAALKDEDFLVLNPGKNLGPANSAIIAAGTGLGECTLYWDGKHHVPVPSEAGHSDFAPYDDLSTELIRYLRNKGLFTNIEQILSGPGLVNIYSFLRDTTGMVESADVIQAMRMEDPAAVIAQAASEGRCKLCMRTLEIFVCAYGAEAGNLALRTVAVGGIYLSGGISRRILSNLQDGAFMRWFINKDRQASLLSQIPVRVILNDNTPLFGAVRYLAQR
jgi:glucokinase